MRRLSRWTIAAWINRIPNQCWTDLVSWALGGPGERRLGNSRLPWRPATELCRRDAAENDGRCWCSKIRAGERKGARR